jgi:hypothetical protein
MTDILLRTLTWFLMVNTALSFSGINQTQTLSDIIKDAMSGNINAWFSLITTLMGGAMYNVVKDANVPDMIAALVFFPLVVMFGIAAARAIRILARS